jgi:hypothetical protein
MMAEVQQRAAPAGPPEHLAVRVAARLLAALGQAVIYAAINGDQQRPQPVLDLRRVGEAVSGLGLAIRDAPPDTPSSRSAPTSPPGLARPWKSCATSSRTVRGRSVPAANTTAKTTPTPVSSPPYVPTCCTCPRPQRRQRAWS